MDENNMFENQNSNEQQDGINRNNGYQQNHEYQNNGYQQGNTYQNNGYQQGNTYQNNNYQPNNTYQNNGYPPNDTYRNNSRDQYQQYRPYGGQQSYNDGGLELEEPVKISEWVLTFVILAVPCVNLIMMFVWAFSRSEKKSKSNFFKAYLIFFGIMMVLMMLFSFAMVFMASALS